MTPNLLSSLEQTAAGMQMAYPESVITYLDANFPFINGFPMLPHLSHNNGKKLDLAFFYNEKKSGEALNHYSPSWIGYGVFEEPKGKEVNTPEFCRAHGYFQYSILSWITSQSQSDLVDFDNKRTQFLIRLFVADSNVKKIFIEPHLKQRLNLTSNKIRFHGCGSVRHDDHIHIQL